MSRPLVDVLFPGDPSIGAAEASIEAARQKQEAKMYKEDDELLEDYVDSYREDLLVKAKEWRDRQSEYERNDKQDRDSKCQPLTESEALWRIELALLRVARALESSNDR